jgi:toxin ParE1/3/4
MSKPVHLRRQADQDIKQIVEYYRSQANDAVAARFIDALETAVARLGANPSSGSPRLSYELDIADLRALPIKRFPHIAFYIERPDHIDLWRVLHSNSDIPTWLSEPGETPEQA